MRVLSVDDDQDILLVLSAALRNMGYEDVTCASSGDAALETLQTAGKQFDCFLLDIQMPRMDGVELCAQIRAMPQYKFAPIIMLTAKSDGDSLDHAFAAGATDYVTKPFDLNELNERLTNAEAGRDNKGQTPDTSHLAGQSVPSATPVGIDMLAPLQLLNVTGMVSALAMHNYLDQLYRGGDEDVQALCVRIMDSTTLKKSMPSSEFYQMLSNVAEAISISQKDSIRLMSYSGPGDLVVILHKNGEFDRSGAETDIQSRIEVHKSNGDIPSAAEITCRVGRPVSLEEHPNSPDELLRAASESVI